MDQFVIVLIIGAIGLIKWVMEKSAEVRSERETAERLDKLERDGPVAHPTLAPRPTARPLPDIDTSARRFREALGLPEESELPKPVMRKPELLPEPAAHFKRKLSDIAADLERRIVPEAPKPPRRSVPPVPQRKAAAEKASAFIGLDELLRSRDGLRKAILVQEILGTPKGLVF